MNYRCLISDALDRGETCDPATQEYTEYDLFGSIDSVADNCAQSNLNENNGQCRTDLCIADAHFVVNLFPLMFQVGGISNSWQPYSSISYHPEYRHANYSSEYYTNMGDYVGTFDPTIQCFEQGVSGTENLPESCCGTYPSRTPVSTLASLSMTTVTMINEDHTIRLLASNRQDWCVFKKYSDFKAGDEIWYTPCRAGNANVNKARKYTWMYDVETHQIQSKGALEVKNKRLCWRIDNPDRPSKQRIRIQACDSNDIKQKWIMIAGRIHPEFALNHRTCVGVETEEHVLDNANFDEATTGIAITTSDCYPNMFGLTNTFGGGCSNLIVGGDMISDDIQAVRPLGQNDENLCFFKKYTGYNNNDEIWIAACGADNANVNKAGKYQFTYDVENGRITSQGSIVKDVNAPFCLRIQNSESRIHNRRSESRIRLAPCNPNDPNQEFDVENGRIYSRQNHRLCVGYEYHKLVTNGAIKGTPLMFNTCFENTWGIRTFMNIN